MSARGSSESTFDVYLYQITESSRARSTRPAVEGTRRPHASRSLTRNQRDRAAQRLKRRASNFLTQAGDLRKLTAHLSTPENLMSSTVFTFFENLIPRLNSIFHIADHFQKGFKSGQFPSGPEGLEFLLRVVKNLNRQIEAALAVSELDSGRCRRRPAYFDLFRLLEQASRSSQNHYLVGEVGLTTNPPDASLQVRGKRPLWYLAVVDLLCRAEEVSPRKGVAARLKQVDPSMVTLTLLPRGALMSEEDTRIREQRQKILGRSSPKEDPAFEITRAIIQHLGGSLTIGKRCRPYIIPLFTLEIPVAPDQGSDGLID